MASCSLTSAKPTLLSLSDEALGRIFNYLAITDKYTLQSCTDGISLAKTNKRLRRIFSAQLTHITPLVENKDTETFSPDICRELVGIAGENLRELHVPECHREYLYELPNLCPNLQTLHFVERYHVSEELPCCGTDDDEDAGDGANDDNAEESNSSDDVVGDNLMGDSHASGNEATNEESNENNISGNEHGEFNIIDTDTNNRDKDDKTRSGDDGHNTAETKAKDFINYCPIVDIFPHLNLRKFSAVRLPRQLCTSIMNMPDRSLEELHLYRMREHQLPMLTPLISLRLKALTLTTGFEDNTLSERVSKLIDTLKGAVLHIPSVTVRIPGPDTLNTLWESGCNVTSLDFPDEAASLMAFVRRNSCESECTSIDLAGTCTYPILSSVDRNASISLTKERITARDHGAGLFLTSLPLYDDFLDMDVTHLEQAYILHRCCMAPDEYTESEVNLEWRNRLAGHRLRVIRCSNANVLKKLELSTRVLELFCLAVLSATDWSCLSGVEELYLLGPPLDCDNPNVMKIEDFLEALSTLIDAFQGGFICMGIYGGLDCSECSDPELALQYSQEAKEAIDRYVARGGDAATVSTYINAVVDLLKQLLEDA